GRGRSVLNWLKKNCVDMGVKFVEGETDQLIVGDSNGIEGVSVRDETGQRVILTAGAYVLANGGLGGYIFESTNRSIRNSAHELAYRSGVELSGVTTHMFH